MLGLSPTQDITEIKRAYARAAKLHHPEEDPEGFQRVKEAYQQAVSYAKRNAGTVHPIAVQKKEAFESRKPESKGKPEPEQQPQQFDEVESQTTHTGSNTPKPDTEDAKKPFDFSVLESAPPEKRTELEAQLKLQEVRDFVNQVKKYNQELEERQERNKAAERKSEPQEPYDFDEWIAEGAKKQEEKVRFAVDLAKNIYENWATRNQKSNWKRYFSCQEFLLLQKDRAFAMQFLNYFLEHKKFNHKLWNNVFLPVLKDWAMLWPEVEIQNLFARLAVPMQSFRETPGWKRFSAITPMLIIAVLVLQMIIPMMNLRVWGERSVKEQYIKVQIGGHSFTGNYSGIMQGRKANGRGSIQISDEKSPWVYNGTWADSKAVSSGTCENMPFQFSFQGEMLAGTYTGNLIDGVPYGEGDFHYASGGKTLDYKGMFVTGQARKEGTLKTTFLSIMAVPQVDEGTQDDSLQQQKIIGSYSGAVIDGIPSGEGEFTKEIDSDRVYTYKGQWKNGTWNGHGELTWKNKRYNSLIGTFEDGVFLPDLKNTFTSLGTGSVLAYTVSDKAKTFLSAHSKLFPATSEKELQPYVDAKIRFQDVVNQPNQYGDRVIKLTNATITQAEEVGFIGEDRLHFFVISGNNEAIYCMYYIGASDAKEGDKVTAYGLPLGKSREKNVVGETIDISVMAGCFLS